jgi:hypothetical protein
MIGISQTRNYDILPLVTQFPRHSSMTPVECHIYIILSLEAWLVPTFPKSTSVVMASLVETSSQYSLRLNNVSTVCMFMLMFKVDLKFPLVCQWWVFLTFFSDGG